MELTSPCNAGTPQVSAGVWTKMARPSRELPVEADLSVLEVRHNLNSSICRRSLNQYTVDDLCSHIDAFVHVFVLVFWYFLQADSSDPVPPENLFNCTFNQAFFLILSTLMIASQVYSVRPLINKVLLSRFWIGVKDHFRGA